MFGLDPYFRDLDRLTDWLWGTAAGTPSRPLTMPMDVWREGEKFVAEFDLPGISEDSLDVSVEGDAVTVRAERPDAGDDRTRLVAERPVGMFTRRLQLDSRIDVDKVRADYSDGVLRVTLPLAEAAKPRKIAVVPGLREAISA
nr:HSP20 family small heat-shock protein [Mycobacterium sp. QGD 101]